MHTCGKTQTTATGEVKDIISVGSLLVGHLIHLIVVDAIRLKLVRHAQFPERQARRAHEPLRLEFLQ